MVIAERDTAITQHRATIAQHLATIDQRDKTIRARDIKIDKLTHEIAHLRRMRYGAKTEAMSAEQRELFEESIDADIAALETQLAELTTPETRAPRRQPVRRALPAELRREVTVHEPASCDCAECGNALVKIGEHASEKLEVVPMDFYVRQDIYPQYACRRCDRIVAEPVAPALIDRGEAGPSVLAQVAISKYVDHLPLYRQEAIFARHGIELSRSTLAEWIGKIGIALWPLVAELRRRLRTAPVLHADETPVAQLDPGSGKTKR
ncbi:MAG TPA: IS66 family transposase, partial [Rhodanobacteraceae bacterium]|nr:IS66 family transposase [Rhodanobacteraceae bacterium]